MDDFMDTLYNFLILAVAFMIALVLSKCISTDKAAKIDATTQKLDDTQRLLVMVQSQVDYGGSKISFSDLMLNYYYSGNDMREKMKPEIQSIIRDSIEKGAGASKQCWEFKLQQWPKMGEPILDVWENCESHNERKYHLVRHDAPKQTAFIPIPFESSQSALVATFGSSLNVDDTTFGTVVYVGTCAVKRGAIPAAAGGSTGGPSPIGIGVFLGLEAETVYSCTQ